MKLGTYLLSGLLVSLSQPAIAGDLSSLLAGNAQAGALVKVLEKGVSAQERAKLCQNPHDLACGVANALSDPSADFKDNWALKGDRRVLMAPRGVGLNIVAVDLPAEVRPPFVQTLILFNTSSVAVEALVAVNQRVDVFRSIAGTCTNSIIANHWIVRVEPLSLMICAGAVAI